MKKYLPIVVLSCILQNSYAQNGDYSIGARSSAMAGASVTVEDEWAVLNNIGALSYTEQITVFGTYKNLYRIPELSTMVAGAAIPVLNGTLGFSAFRFGGSHLNEQKASLGFSNRFGLVSLGANLGYFQMNIDGGGTRQTFLFDFGGHAKISEQFMFAAHISNANQAKLSEVLDERIPTLMKTGISYRPTQKLMVNGEVQKAVDSDEQLKLGIEYEVIRQLRFRTGIQTKPFTSNFGAGFELQKLLIDYAYGHHQNLGDIHQFSFTYRFAE